MFRFILVVLCVGLLSVVGSTTAFGTAQPALSVHAVEAPSFPALCGDIDASTITCSDLDVEADGASSQSIFVLVSHADALAGVQFGVSYSRGVNVLGWTNCTGGLAIYSPGWPTSGTAAALVFDAIYPTGQDSLVAIGFFTLAAGSRGNLQLTIDDAIGEAQWLDASTETHAFNPAALGRVDINSPHAGYNPCGLESGVGTAGEGPITDGPETTIVCQHGFVAPCEGDAEPITWAFDAAGITCAFDEPVQITSVGFTVCEVDVPGTVDIVIYGDEGTTSTRVTIPEQTAPTTYEFPVDTTLVDSTACVWLKPTEYWLGGATFYVAKDPAFESESSFGTDQERLSGASTVVSCPGSLLDYELVMWVVADTLGLIDVAGTVVDSLNGLPVSHCAVVAIDTETGETAFSDSTDVNGRYTLMLREESTYDLQFTHAGYFADSLTSVTPVEGVDVDPVDLSTNTVLLVHGVFNGHSIWDLGFDFAAALRSSGFHVPDVVTYVPGVLSWLGQAGRTAPQADRLQQQVRELANDGIQSIDAVGYSMGGLVVRQFLSEQSVATPNRIRSVVMLGTPNHGSELANGAIGMITALRALLVCGPDNPVCFLRELLLTDVPPVLQELAPGSPLFLRLNGQALDNRFCRTHPNEISVRPDVQYYTYAGTAYSLPLSEILFCGYPPERLLGRSLAGLTLCPQNDTVVPVSSVPLMAQSTPTNVTNVIDDGVGCSSSHLGPDILTSCPGLTADPCVANFVVDALQGNVARHGYCRDVPDTSGVPSLIAMETFVGAPSAIGSFDVSVGAADSVEFTASYWAGSGAFSLVDPQGRLVDPDTAAADPTIDYEDLGQRIFYRVRTPVTGDWTLTPSVGASDSAAIVVSGAEFGEVRHALRSDASEILPNATQRVEMALTYQGAPALGMTVNGTATDPQASVSPFTLLDDGIGPDFVAGDAVYTGEITGNSLTGQYEVAVDAQGTLSGGGTLNRKAGTLYFVQIRPDAEVLPQDVVLSMAPGDSLFTIEATVRNIGSATADTVVVAFLEGTTGLTFAESTFVALDPSAQFTMEKDWPIPLGLAEASLGVNVTVFCDPAEDNLTNNEAWSTATVVDVGLTTGSGQEAVTVFRQLPSAFPNPAQRTTRIRYVTVTRGPASVRIFDVSGRQVRTFTADVQEPGIHEAVWDTRDARGRVVPPGVYFYRVETQGWSHSDRLVIVR